MNSTVHKYLGLALRLKTTWLLLLLAALPASLQAQFTFVTNNNQITITAYTGPGGAVSVPGSTNGFNVIAIGAYAFQSTLVTSVTVPDGVASIGQSAFNSCTNLTSVTLPGTITSIGETAFADCFRLTGVTIPADLTTLSNGVFIGCQSLTNIVIPNSVTSIGTNAFVSTGLTAISIPSGVTNIGASAFASCFSLNYVCFEGNAPLSSGSLMFFNDTVSVIYYVSGTTGWGTTYEGIPTAPCPVCGQTPDPYNGFYWTQVGLTIAITNYNGPGGAVAIPTNIASLPVVSIGKGAFQSNLLTSVTIPTGVTNIGANAFANCTGLGSVTISTTVASIGFSAFGSCLSLTTISVATGNQAFSSVAGVLFNQNQTTLIQYPGGKTGPYTIPGTVTTIYTNSFYRSPVTSVTIPSGVITIEDGAFNACESLTSITVPDSVTSIGASGFQNCFAATNIALGSGLTSIGSLGFSDDFGLTAITIPGSVTEIDARAFSVDQSLSNVCFQGNMPTTSGIDIFDLDPVTVIYYVAGTTGWGSTYEGITTSPCVACGIPNAGDLEVAINPPCAVLDGAAWQVDGGAWQNSGAIVTNLVPGNHTVSFTNLVGWLTPASEMVLVNPNITNIATGSYTEGSTPGYVTWINIGGVGNWSSPTNWDLGYAPTPTNVVLIPNTGGSTCVLDVNATVAGLLIGDCAGLGSDGLSINGHTLTVNGPLTVQSNAIFSVDSGVLTAVSNNLISGVLGWTYGTLGGTLTLASNGVLNTSLMNAGKNFNALLTNYGTFNWSADQLNGSGAGAVVYNYGLWNAQDDRTFGGSGTVFNNLGTFRKSGGTGAYPGTYFPAGVVFNQLAGIVDVQSGTNGLELNLQGGGSFTGGYFTTNSSGYTFLGSSSFNINGTTTSSNVVAGTSLAGTNVIRGGLTWQSGSWNNAVITVSSNTVLTIDALTFSKDISGSILTNYGTVNWVQDQLNGDGGTVIYNYGLWDAETNAYFNGGGGLVFNNLGTFLKSGGVPGYPGTYFSSGTTFNQAGGVLNVQMGDVTLGSAYSLTNGTMNFGINNATNNGVLLAGNIQVGGTLSVNLNPDFTPAVGEVIGLIGGSVLTGTFSHVNVPAGMSVVYAANGVSLNVTGPVPVQILDPIRLGTNVMFQFPTATNQNYTIQQNTNLTTTNWVLYSNIVGNGAVFQFQTPILATPAQRFFRVVQP